MSNPFDKINLEDFLEVTLKKCGKILKENFHKEKKIFQKDGHFDLVTEFDREVENILVATLAQKFHNSVFLGEEGHVPSNTKSKIKWVIDPIDGTLNFVKKLPSIAISVAAELDGDLLVGACYDPICEEFYYARKGLGAYLNGHRIYASPVSKIEEAGISMPICCKCCPEVGFVRRSGSSVLDMCYVARGALDGFWCGNLKIWDYLATKLIVEEAGGEVTIKPEANSATVIASNKYLSKSISKWI